MPLSAVQAHLLAKARGSSSSKQSAFNGIEEEEDELDALPHREGPEAGPSRVSWPPARPNHKRPRSPQPALRPAAIDLDGSQPTAATTASERVLLATINASATGIRYYSGKNSVKSGDIVKLNREPLNQYDSNAIKVDTVTAHQIGHIPRDMAAALAPLMDSHEIKVRARVADYTSSPAFTLPLVLSLLGKAELADDPRLAFARPRVPQTPPSAGLADLTEGYQRRETQRPDALAALFSEFDPASLPLHPQPKLKTKLLPHQLQALAWMTSQEHLQPPKDDKPVQLWQKRDSGKFYNVASQETSDEPPTLGRGGALCDEMTLSSIALIASPPDGSAFLEKPEELDERYCEATLIVCPVSVISNWTSQIHQHAGKRLKRVHVYHGDGRAINRSELKEQDVVITTYHTLSAEAILDDAPPAKKKKAKKNADGDAKNGKLHRIAWRRVILDEGHVIRNVKTQMAKACHTLRAERRWILTGVSSSMSGQRSMFERAQTPIINSSKDCGAMVHFLRLCTPLDDPAEWTKYVERGFKKGTQTGQILLRAVISATTLRRLKDMKGPDGQPLVRLPELKVYLHKVKLEENARADYDEVERAVQNSVMKTIQQGDLQRTYSAVLVFLLRLRQIACHPSLCPKEFMAEVRAGNAALPPPQPEEADAVPEPAISPEQRIKLQRTLLELRYEDCSICFSAPEEPVITACSHAFCLACINQVIDYVAGQNKAADCPMCRAPLSKETLVPLPDEPLPAEGAETEEETEVEAVIEIERPEGADESIILSAKSRELVRLLKGASADGHRSLVFSQWTSHLHMIGQALEESDIDFVRFDGSMSQKKRARIVDEFQDGKGPDVMLLSLHCGALGLNLTAASVVFLLDPWWQGSIETQAIDRTYRIGQVKPVSVFQLVAEDTVEERVLEIQARKAKLVADAFSGSRGATSQREKTETRLGDVLEAFGLARNAAAVQGA